MLIGITGKIGSGKTTVGNYLVNYWEFQEYIMAEPIKHIGAIFGFSRSQLYGTQNQKLEIHPHWGISGREFLQKIGTDMFRDRLREVIPNMKIDKSVWCDIFKLKYNRGINTVVSDVRFLDEAQTIKDLGGIIIRIVRDVPYGNSESESNSHISEIEQDGILQDFTITNNGDVKTLYRSIDNVLQSKLLLNHT